MEGYVSDRAAPDVWRCVSYDTPDVHFRFGKKYAVTLLTGAVSVIIPYIGLSKTGIYRLPLPLPFLLGTDFLQGILL